MQRVGGEKPGAKTEKLDSSVFLVSVLGGLPPSSTENRISNVVNQHTELEHTPKRNLYQQAISRDSFHSWPGGLPGVCSRGVL